MQIIWIRLEYLKPYNCMQIICIRLEYLKPYNCIQIICIRLEYLNVLSNLLIKESFSFPFYNI